MTLLCPREVVHRGVIEAAGYCFAVLNAADEAAARARILELWEPGASVWRADGLLVIELAGARTVRVELSPGLPLVREGHWLLAAPLGADELAALQPARELSLVRVVGGQAVVSTLGERVSPGSWIGVANWSLMPARALFSPPKAIALMAVVEPVDVREALGAAVLPRADEVDGLVARVRELNEGGPLAGGDAGPGLGHKLLEAAVSWFAPASSRPSSASSPASDQPGERAAGPLDSLKDWINRRAWAFLRVSRLNALLGRQHARQLERMMQMFEQGDLSQALRHAIPLNGQAGDRPSFPSFGAWEARDSLAIVPYRSTNATTLGLADELFSDLRQMYRRAFEELVRRKQIDEAAFLLLELLGDVDEGVEFLEQHGRFELAARVAEARGLAPGLVVRLWFLAGNVERALLIVRRSGAFADAVLRLERSKDDMADALRSLWAKTLVESGDFAQAVEVIWPVEHARHLAAGWMDCVLEGGGSAAARMLARKIGLMPESFSHHQDQLVAMLDDEGPDGLTARRALLTSLLAQPAHAQCVAVARAGVRAMVRDNARQGAVWEKSRIEAVAKYARDQALTTDLRRVAEQPARARELFCYLAGASDRGTLAIFDAARLPDGRLLVALGELGARLLTADGRTVVHFDEPTERLVISDHGDRALGVVKRGEVLRLTRFDLRARTARRWTNAPSGRFCEGYDGQMWFFARGDELMGIDTLAESFGALWHVPDLVASVAVLARSALQLSILLASDDAQCWTYELPQLVLRDRKQASQSNTVTVESVSADGAALCMDYSLDETVCVVYGDRVLWRGSEYDELCSLPSLSEEHIAFCMREGQRNVVYLEARARAQRLARIELDGLSSAPGHRLDARTLCVWDALGRLIVYDIESSRLVADLRL
ncbi:MAG: hypothetical protein H0U74_16490 [Bradymonadaceae bacterium]|nr:hypothetical protein [Lujinxingiaceae bacterium]